MRAALLAPLLLLTLAVAGCTQPPPPTQPPGPSPASPPHGLALEWLAPVDLRGTGYEPSISVDQKGTIYYTAHKVLDRPETWPYLGSWFLVSRDDGKTWGPPAAPGGLPVNLAQQFLGDEGDIAIDARGWAYFVDTYLADNHLHAWSDQGQTWQSSEPVQKSTGLDDRPWIAAQGDGVLHYLGNNGNEVNGGRHWYYVSADAGLTWSEGMPVPGGGWATIAADNAPGATDVYIVYEAQANGPGDMLLLASHDSGATWEQPVKVGNRTGSGRAYPVVSAAPDGVAWVLWMDCGAPANCGDTGGGQSVDQL
ncbi:MAG: glycoside hydrolase, partial [Halobacteriales archaeon]|nr:glycoside hydrolase [Halobacteriales archaeon]